MTGWNLPDGCTDRDIELAMGCLTRCASCGKEVRHNEDLEGIDEYICSSCDGDAAYDRMRDEKMEKEWEQKP
jgi:DNA-directed RNA polymerase subunit RPC12/RpoP